MGCRNPSEKQLMSSTLRRPISAYADTNRHVAKRQQVRKGTFSCWACKRRKTRCEFKDRSSSVCVSCQRRGTSCVGQEFSEPAEPIESPEPAEHSNGRVEERIVRVESLVSQLIQQRSTPSAYHRTDVITDNDNENDNTQDKLSVQLTDSNVWNGIDWLSSSSLTTDHQLLPGSRSLSTRLLAMLPHPPKAALILTQGKFFNLPIHVRGQPSRQITSSGTGPERLAQVSELPPPTAHPVHFARKLIQLALCLHQLNPPIYDVARSYVNVASRYVTSQDFLVESIDGIETLLLEACYHINLGDLRRAWLVVRRALGIAQLLGLHLQTRGPDCQEESVWFRLVLADSSLSWMLGLPLGVTDNSFAGEHELVADVGAARLERIHGVILGRIITRDMSMQRRRRHLEDGGNSLYDDSKETQDIDHQLKQAARSLPTTWWFCPTLNNESTHVETMEMTGRLIAQMHHHFLLVILHQPYLIGTFCSLSTARSTVSACSPFDEAYSQTVVLSASREILSRFLLLRSFHRALSYRGVDDKAFVASTMFLLVHIRGHRLGRANMFDHQRPHDLGIINEVIRIIGEISRANKDALSTSMVQVLRRLVEIEAHSADGGRYFIWIEEVPVGKGNFEIRKDEDGLSLPIPYFGILRIALREPPSLQLPTNPGHGSLNARELMPTVIVATGNNERMTLIEDQDPADVPSGLNFQIEDPAPTNEGIDYNEYLDLQSSANPHVFDISQSSTLVPQETSQLNQTVNPQDYAHRELDTLFSDSWLSKETLAEDTQGETEMWPIDG